MHPINRIIVAACRHFALPRHMLIGQSRKRQFAYPRQVAMYVAHLTGASLPEIGRRLDRDHTTVLSGYRKIVRLLDDDRVAADCEDVARAIGMVM